MEISFSSRARKGFWVQSSVAMPGMAWGWWGVRGQLQSVWGAAKTWPSPAERTQPWGEHRATARSSSWPAGAGEREETSLAWEVLEVREHKGTHFPGRCWGCAGAQGCVSHLVSLVPACPHAMCSRNSAAFPVGGCRDSRNHAGNPLRNLRGVFCWGLGPNTVFYISTWVLLSQGRCTLSGRGRWCCGPSIPLKVHFSHVCGVSKGWLRGAARAEVFPQVLPLSRVQSILWVRIVGNSKCHFWSWLLVHGALCKIKSPSLSSAPGTWQGYGSAAEVPGDPRGAAKG